MNYGFAKLKNIPQIDQKIKSRENLNIKPKYRQKLMQKKETQRINPEIHHLPEFLGSENKKWKRGKYLKV